MRANVGGQNPLISALALEEEERTADIDVLGHGSRKIRFFRTVPKLEHPVAHFQASILQAKAGRRRWLPVGGGGGGGDSHALGVNSID